MAKKRPAKSDVLAKTPGRSAAGTKNHKEYDGLRVGISELLANARLRAARTVNSILTATYWEVSRRIVEFEQGGKLRAAYGEELLRRLSSDLLAAHGRGFSERN